MSSSSCNATGPDVFLSFHGPDTGYKFLSHLYAALDRHGVKTYKDDPERPGVRTFKDDPDKLIISQPLIQAIHDSKISIVVLSKNYASSAWCLDELVRILNCHHAMKKLVIPVFYHIGTSIVLEQGGSLKKAFERHETQYDKDRLAMWRVMLTDLVSIKNISGFEVDKDTLEADIINQIVDKVRLYVDPLTLDIAKYPVGLASRVESIKTLLSSDTEGVIKIGIYGMGGVGKTTLAKAVYNKIYHLFNGSCFLMNVRETSRTERGLACLQKQLINDVLRCKNIKIDNVDQGLELIRARICSSKVLIIIDDLDNSTPLNFLVGPFASGSVIIITTRDEEILDQAEVETRYRYMVKELDDTESHTLLTHVYGSATPNENFTVWSKDILRLAGGLPLTLEVVGSYFSEHRKVEWGHVINQLKQCSIKTIEENLMISYDALASVDPMLQDIFLDIACFFIGRKKEEVVKIMETYYTFVDWKIEILKKKCLLQVNEREELVMHEQLQAMGRNIACNGSLGDPGKYSRLCTSKDIYDVLKANKGTEAVEAIIPSNFYNDFVPQVVSFATETFERMSKLRFLYLKNVELSGRFEHIFEELRWFYWDCCPLKFLPMEFSPRKLVILALPGSKLRTMWEPNMVPQVFLKLRTLNMSYSLNFTTTPDFTKLPLLETLNLEGCASLEEVHISIGCLEGLVSLNLHGCVNLMRLPDSICQLKALQNLDIGFCSRLEALPIDLGKIESLKQLNATALSVSRVPDSIGRLYKLVTLSLGHNDNLQTLPISICNLRALKYLDLGHCPQLSQLSTKMLPVLFNLKQMEYLCLTNCKDLTEVFGLKVLTFLRELHLRGCSSSLLKQTLTKRLFKKYSQLGHEVQICIPVEEFPNWIGQWKHCIGRRTMGSRMSISLPPNLSHSFLGTILYFKHLKSFSDKVNTYSVKNITSGFVWSSSFDDNYCEAHVTIVPSSVFWVRDGDHRIELTAKAKVLGIYLLYKTEITRIDKYESTSFESYTASKRLKRDKYNVPGFKRNK